MKESPAEEIISQQEKIAELELENQLLRKQLQEAQERFEWLLGILLKTMKTLELYSELTP